MNKFIKLNQILCLLLVLLLSCKDSENLQPISIYDNIDDSENASKKADTYVLIHGAWHPASVWDEVKADLEKHGNTVIAVQLPGLGNDPTPANQITLQTHVDAVKSVLNLITEPVILVGHSYGGVVISQVGEDMPAKIKKLVYVSAFMLQDGQTLLDVALQDTASVVTKNVIPNNDNLTITVPQDKLLEAFYNYSLGNSNPNLDEKVNKIIPLIKPQPLLTFVMPVHLTSTYNSLAKVYISCPEDHAITLRAQQMMYSKYPGTDVQTIQNSDHSPFVSRPNQLSNILKKL